MKPMDRPMAKRLANELIIKLAYAPTEPGNSTFNSEKLEEAITDQICIAYASGITDGLRMALDDVKEQQARLQRLGLTVNAFLS